MLKKYIQDIAKHEARKILLSNYKEKLVYEIKQKKELEEENRRIKSQLLNNIYFNMYQKQVEHTELLVKEKEKEIEELKVLYEAEKDKNYKTLESEDLKQENDNLKKENEKLKNISRHIVIDNDGKIDSFFNQELKQENEKLKKELLDSKNGLNGANHVIKNNKEWINSQDKKIKELEEKIRCLKSDKEDLQYNLRRKSTQKIQLETKNKVLEEKLYAISNQVSSYNTAKETGDLSFFSLMCLINDIEYILKES